jgi:hypothetical protein
MVRYTQGQRDLWHTFSLRDVKFHLSERNEGHIQGRSWILRDYIQDDNYEHTVSRKHFIYKADLTAQVASWRSNRAWPLCDLVSFDYSFDSALPQRPPKRGVINEGLSAFIPWVALNLGRYLLPCQY